MGEKVENEAENKPADDGQKKADAPAEGVGKKDEGAGDQKAADGGGKNEDVAGEKKAADVGGKKDDGTGEPKAADVGGKKDEEGPITVVLKLDMHCEGCAKKVKRSIRHFEGVETVKADHDSKKLTVTGTMDPAWLRERVESKTKKKVELISPQPKKDGGAGGGAATEVTVDDEKSEKKLDDKKADVDKKPKEVVVSTMVMKIRLHCDGCAHKIKRVILKNVDGVNSATTDLEKDLITVTGTMDPEELAAYLEAKLKRAVEIVLPKKAQVAGGKEAGEKKGKEGGGEEKKQDGSDRKEVESKVEPGAGGGGKGSEEIAEIAKVEANRMEYYGHNPHTYYATPTDNQYDYIAPMYHHHQGYSGTGYVVNYRQEPPLPPPTYLNTNEQMFSDENPNGCSVM